MLLPQTKFRIRQVGGYQSGHSYFHDRGSVTAELAMALPAVSLVIAITLGAFALQIERMKLVDVSASAARAAARGEPQEEIFGLIAEMTAPNPVDDLKIVFEVRENMSCVILSRGFQLPGLGAMKFDLSELQCARKMGL
jgi:hypothetical protein